jgi:hypothetical protein
MIGPGVSQVDDILGFNHHGSYDRHNSSLAFSQTGCGDQPWLGTYETNAVHAPAHWQMNTTK